MERKFIKVWTLALLQVVIVGNLQILPANAIYGFSLPFLYFLAIIFFFIPCIVMVAKLAASYPQTGGAYIWCEQAFGSKTGFFVIAILWISNLLWYPSIFALIAANLAYLINPVLAQNKMFVVGFSVLFFWIITGLNCIGIKPSTRISVWGSVFGIIVPMMVIIVCALIWWLSGKPLAISLADTPLIPDLRNLNGLGFLIAVIISLFGLELTAVHAGDVVNPKWNYPISLLISGILLIVLLLCSELSIAVIVPADKLSVVTGLLDALTLFFTQSNFASLLFLILLLVFLGNLGSVAAWMLGSTRGMFVACQRNHVFPFLQKANRFGAPIGVLIFEAIIFTCASSIFLIFPGIIDSFWLLLVLASQITLIYYVVLFVVAIRLRCSFLLMLLGILSSLVAIVIGFIPPPNLTPDQIRLFDSVIIVGLIFSIILPIIFLIKK